MRFFKEFKEKFKREKSSYQGLKISCLIFGILVFCFMSLPSLISKDKSVISYSYEEIFTWSNGIVPSIWVFIGFVMLLIGNVIFFFFFDRKAYLVSLILDFISFVLIVTQPIMTLNYYRKVNPSLEFDFGVGAIFPVVLSFLSLFCVGYIFFMRKKEKKNQQKNN